MRALLWGDPDRGPHAATRFQPGARHPLHKHSNDIVLVVLEGAYIYETDRGIERVDAGDCIFIPGGDVHRSSADPQKGCLFFQLTSGAFDLNVVE